MREVMPTSSAGRDPPTSQPQVSTRAPTATWTPSSQKSSSEPATREDPGGEELHWSFDEAVRDIERRAVEGRWAAADLHKFSIHLRFLDDAVRRSAGHQELEGEHSQWRTCRPGS